MAKLPPMKPVQLVRLLKKHGFIEERQRGSHLILYRASDKKLAVVPMHNHDLAKGTLASILKSAGIAY